MNQTMQAPEKQEVKCGDSLILLENIKIGTYITWEMYTNADYKISVVMKDDVKEYVDNSSQGVPHKVLSEGYEKVEGDNLRLIIHVETTGGQHITNLKFFVLPYSIPRTNGSIAGQGYNIMMEDEGDRDYNDLVIFLHACPGRY